MPFPYQLEYNHLGPAEFEDDENLRHVTPNDEVLLYEDIDCLNLVHQC